MPISVTVGTINRWKLVSTSLSVKLDWHAVSTPGYVISDFQQYCTSADFLSDQPWFLSNKPRFIWGVSWANSTLFILIHHVTALKLGWNLGRSAVLQLQSTCILHLVFSGFSFDTRTITIRIVLWSIIINYLLMLIQSTTKCWCFFCYSYS